jgi:hypothetical protein
VATLFGTVDVWRRLYEPLERGVHSMHPLERRLGIEAGCATPALAERVGKWAADHTQRQVLTMLAGDHVTSTIKWQIFEAYPGSALTSFLAVSHHA